MPSWNEKPHVAPTVNVNLSPCTCGGPLPRLLTPGPDVHPGNCHGAPVLVPLSLEPWRSVTFSVALGECTAGCSAPGATRALSERGEDHHPWCPGRHLKVSCSVSGKTWPETEVVDVDNAERHDGLFSGVDPGAVLAACRERWALVKALVTGDAFIPNHWGGPVPVMDLFAQRDAVFAALAELARLEEAHATASERATRAMGSKAVLAQWPRRSIPSLQEYVERLVEQVGVLGVES